MGGDQFVARKRGPPIALAARDEDRLALFVGEPIERLLSRCAVLACEREGPQARRPAILRPFALAVATTINVRLHHELALWQPSKLRPGGEWRRAAGSLGSLEPYNSSYNGGNFQGLFMLISYRTCHRVHYFDKPTLLVCFRLALVDRNLYVTDRLKRFETR